MIDVFDYIDTVKRKEKRRKIILISVCITSLIAGIYIFIQYQIELSPLESAKVLLPEGSIRSATIPVNSVGENLFGYVEEEMTLTDTLIPTDIEINIFPYQDTQSLEKNIVSAQAPKAKAKTPEITLSPIQTQVLDQPKILDDSISIPQMISLTEAATQRAAMVKDTASSLDTTSASTQTSSIQSPVRSRIEVMPSFPKGSRTLYKFIKKNLEYPEEAMENKIHGKVLVRFLVDKEGKLSQFEVVRGLGYGCDEEALRVAKLMPAWKPGKKSGKPIDVEYTIPVNFEMK